MGLKNDIYKAFEINMTDNGNLTLDEGTIKRLNTLSDNLSGAIIDFILKQEFRIIQLESQLKVNNIKTTAPLEADVLPSVTTAVNGGMAGSPPTPVANATGVVSKGKKGVMIPPINLDKNNGQGGSLMVDGTAIVNEKKTSVASGRSRKSTVMLLKGEVKDP